MTRDSRGSADYVGLETALGDAANTTLDRIAAAGQRER